jgi:hypothetical protein
VKELHHDESDSEFTMQDYENCSFFEIAEQINDSGYNLENL